ncbi:alkylresorcinol/alkylpyrone synthase [Motilibacter peucedani]|uniref:Alkylresorcinol/alkylpyrone synthase n=1 Tax=Motilibacter peucedani TaxID=598650 RepID=A0A420XSN8_9ACTN|nr:3-oxoacyl-[acyl-carrier-protein] synthase III C-terminal domain-containing protein [Motilibacter peucedani]RKS77893.1 alkylresorcinol/alkylpyrone synthase [Motilibacter peucedani]
MARIAAVAGALPEHRYPQQQITEAFTGLMRPEDDRRALLERFHRSTGVEHRHLALPIEAYAELRDFTGANTAYVSAATALGARAVAAALERSGLAGSDVDLVISTTVTGVGVPSLDARLVNLVGLRPDVKRLPLFGLGCVAGAAGVARAADHLVGHPDDVVVLVAVELCSLTFQLGDSSVANLIATGLFGDGASAVVLVGDRRAQAMGLDEGTGTPRVVASRSSFYPGTEDVMGWDVGTTGFRVVLSASVPDVVEEHLAGDVKGFLADAGLDIGDIGSWIGHPGGPKVLDTVTRVLGLPDDALELSWRSMRETGNLSSVSVLNVLERTAAERRPAAGEPSVMFAMGPGFCSELVLLEW